MKLAFSRWLFDQIHSRNLIYNQCWEDPALDHEVLNIGPSDRIVMITSAGCNALDYLLRDPAEITCVDVNPHQNALLELKLAALERLPYERFSQMFGRGRIRNHVGVYRELLRDRLTEHSREIWDRRIHYFDPDGPGLYFHGTAGVFARTTRWYSRRCCGLGDALKEFQQIYNLREQAEFYRRQIAPRLWSPTVRFLINRKTVLSMLGVPAQQIQQIKQSSNDGISAFVEEKVEKTLTRIPIAENYFWRVYMNGYYPAGCCPNYLKHEYFETLRARISRIRIQTSTLTEFLSSSFKRYSVFVLLDHMDWLSATPQMLEEEWRVIMNCALPRARIIYRSGNMNCGYIPEFAARRLEFQPDRTAELNNRDRAGTYGSFHFARVTT
ncbi:MAG TPA: BtaA family protein [Terriglobia bacterium]|nr:BtaA family protein [Terriglobia bacterium]